MLWLSKKYKPQYRCSCCQGVRFLQAISNGGQTSEAFPSILASALPPLENNESKVILRRSVTLAEALRSSGYHTIVFPSKLDLSRYYNYDCGFDVFDDNDSQLSTRGFKYWINRIAESNRLMTRVLGKGNLTSRIYRMYLSILPDRLTRPIINAELMVNKAISHSELEILTNLYDGEIKYTDEVIGWILHEMGNCLDDTVVIIAGDHGDEFGEHGRFGHNTVYDELLHVPLIIAGPGVGSDILVEQQVSLIDLAPTIADLTGIGSVPSFMGRSLLPVIEGRGDIVPGTISTYINQGLWQRNIAYRIPGWKYILTESMDNGRMISEELYDLKNDPGEINNLHGIGNEGATYFELDAREKINQFKRLKSVEKTNNEK